MPQKEQGVLEYKLAQEICFTFGRIIPVRHIGLISQINIMLTVQQTAAQDGFHYGQAPGPGIKNTYGQLIPDLGIRGKIGVVNRACIIKSRFHDGYVSRPALAGCHKDP
jgi:hypothetical protein